MRAALYLAAALIAGAAQADALDAIFGEIKTGQTPGCAVGITLHGKLVARRAYGDLDMESHVKLTPDSRFEAGSVSKQFTAAAIAMLASEGRLSLDDDVRKYLPELPDYGHVMTIRMLLSHTSGLREWSDLAELEGWPRTTRVVSQDYAAQAIFRQKAVNFVPGSRYLYSNSNYVLALLLIERVSGQKFTDFTRERIFAPLGLAHTNWRADFSLVETGRAKAYQQDKQGRWHLDMPFENVIGHAGLITTVGDLLRWTDMLAHPTAEQGRWVGLMVRPTPLNGGGVSEYGLGLMLQPVGGRPAVYHTGSTAGYRAYLGHLTDEDLSLAVLCNSAQAASGSWSKKILALYAPKSVIDPDPKRREPPPVQVAEGSFTGTYASPELPLASLRFDGLKVTFASGMSWPLTAIAANRLRSDEGWVFEFSEHRVTVSTERSFDMVFEEIK